MTRIKGLKRWLLPGMVAAVVLYLLLLIAVTMESQRRSVAAVLANTAAHFEAQVRIGEQSYQRFETASQQLPELPGFQLYYSNLLLGMSYQYGLADSLYRIRQQVHQLLLRSDSLAQVHRVVFTDLHGGSSEVLYQQEGQGGQACDSEAAGMPPAWQVSFSGHSLCVRVPVLHKQVPLGYLSIEASDSLLHIGELKGDGEYYLQDISGNLWQWQAASGLWQRSPWRLSLGGDGQQNWLVQGDELLFFAPFKGGYFRLLRKVPRQSLLALTQQPAFILALLGLALLVLLGVRKALHYSRENLGLNALVAQERQHSRELAAHNAQLAGEIRQRQALERQLSHRAQHDDLTGLPNRLFIYELIGATLARSRQEGGLQAVLFCDLDRFKQVNDTLGHDAGDELIRSAAQRLRQTLSGSDTVARFGGDEFLILLGRVSTRVELQQRVEQVVEAFRPPFQLRGHEFAITASVGVAIFPLNGVSSTELIRQADTALYKAKEQGRSRSCYYEPDQDSLLQARLGIEQQLMLRNWDERFHLVYQPIVEIASGELFAVETLLRWSQREGERESLRPDQFIPVAEDLGLINEIGAWGLGQVARDFQDCAQERLRVFVNVSPLQFAWRESLHELVNRLQREYGLAPGRLGIEVTESCLLRNSVQVQRELDQLVRQGVQLAIDDFGTGYSSLSYVKRFPFQLIKIDKSFVRDICDDPGDLELVRAVIAMARAMRLRVVAEGVETERQFRLLQSLGCDYAQGYYLAPELPLAQLRARYPFIQGRAEGAAATSVS